MAKVVLFVSLFLSISVLSAYFIQGSSASPTDETCAAGDSSCSAACQDQEKECSYWASIGECDENPKYMHNFCTLSCGLCEGKEPPKLKSNKKACDDSNEKCETWAESGECEANPGYMLSHCRLSCHVCVDPDLVFDLGVPQALKSDHYPKIFSSDVEESIKKSEEFLRSVKLRMSLKRICKNTDEMCTIWAIDGDCEDLSVKKRCPAACHACEVNGIEGRCPVDPNQERAWEEGDLDAMFEKLTKEPYLTKYSVETLSSPATGGPWVITMDDIVTAEEAERLIELGAKEGYVRSSDVGKMNADGTHEKDVNSGRTSTNAWCLGECYRDASAQSVIQKLSDLTGIDEANSEYLQLLRYEPGQFYQAHHDYIPIHLKRQVGVRILTMYLYLNDVEEGGGTNFDKLNITVMPKRGRALLWPSVKNSDPNIKDDRTTHQALPVEKGIKYGANAWFHMNDFKTPYENNCAK